MELKTQVGTTNVTFLVDDEATVSFQKKVVEDCSRWLKESWRRLTRAIDCSAKAMVQPKNASPRYWDFLNVYFGIPRRSSEDTQYRLEINTILQKMNQTNIGLNGDLVIADLSQMPGIAKAQFQCMNAINWALGKETGSLAGLIFVDVVEAATRYVKSFWQSSPTGVTMNPYAGPIHLNFDELWRRGERNSVVTLIHEATHKFAQTTDEQYFPEESAWDIIDNAIAACKPLMDVKYKSFDELFEDARKIALTTGKLAPAVKIVESMERSKTLNNADGVANFVYETAELATVEEIKLIMGVSDK